MTHTDPSRFVDSLAAAVNAHDIEALVSCFADDYVNETPVHPARGFAGSAQVRQNWSTIFHAVPDITAVVTARAVEGDTVWSEWQMDGTRPDGSPHHMRGVVIFTVKDSKATAARFYLEPLDVGTFDVNAAVAAAVGVATAGDRP